MAGFVTGLRHRSHQAELLDTEVVSERTMVRAYRELAWVNRGLGYTRSIIQLLRQDVVPGSRLRVLDVGCGQGALLVAIRDALSAEVIGVDLRPTPGYTPVPILVLDAVRERLPEADAAVCVLMAHHLTEDELVAMIRNVEKSSRRLIVLDLVRHPVPLWLFRFFVAPLLCRINAADGQTSIRRAYTRAEMNSLVLRAVQSAEEKVTVRHRVAWFWTHQVVDIRWA